MSVGEYLLVLFSIILGLGITELLSSLHHLLHPRARVSWHWLPVLWALNVFLTMVFWWWTMFGFANITTPPSFFELLLILLAPVTLYLIATSALPDTTPGEEVDLRAFYLENRTRFFGLLATYAGLIWLTIVVLGWRRPPGQDAAILGYFLLNVLLMRSASLRTHAILTLVNWAAFVAVISAYWLRIG